MPLSTTHGEIAMRLTLRALALVSVVVFGLSLLLDASLYPKNPCPLGFLFKLYLVFVGVLGIPPTLEQFSLGLSRQGAASMGEPGDGISGRDRLDCHLHGLPEGLLGASTQSAQDGLEL